MAVRTNTALGLGGALLVLICAAAFLRAVARPAVETRKALKLLAATEVGRTSAGDFRTMAHKLGVSVEETPDGFGIVERNRILEWLRLAPQTAVLMSVRAEGNLVTVISVKAWIGEMGQFAKVDIHEFDSHNTWCGDVPVCIKPTSSTMTTYVFFVPGTPISERERLLSFNVRCLEKLGGCKDSRELLPVAWQNQR